MHAHSNVVRVIAELFMLAIGLPLCGLIASVILWQRTRRRTDSDQLELVGLRSIAFAFATYLIWLGLSSLPGPYHTSFATLILMILSMAGVIGACSGLVLMLLRARGSIRIGGAMLALLALGYSLISGLALLTGGAA